MLKILALTLTLLSSQFAVAAPKSILLTTKNTVNFRTAVDEQSATEAMLELIRLDKERGTKNYPLYLVLDSPGGSIVAGLAFIDLLRTLKNVHTVSIFAASMASAIAEANPGKRYVTETGIMMFHRAQASFEGQFEDGEVEQMLGLWKSIVRHMEQINADRMSMPLAEYKAKVKDEYWLFGESAVANKAADELVQIKCSADLIEKRSAMLQAGLFTSVETVYSGCPLLRGPVETAKGE